jgi:AcrR family transcriptional regulator
LLVSKIGHVSENEPAAEAEDPRARSARTKRERTRRALLVAAEDLFARKGWNDTTFEHIAVEAGVSVATAYNHFPSKHVLIAVIVGRLLEPCLARADAALDEATPAVPALKAHIRDLASVFNENRALTVPFVYAVHDYTVRAGGPPDPADHHDPRTIAPVPVALDRMIAAGQERGELRPYPPAMEAATQVANLLMLRAHTRPDEQLDETVEIILTVLLGALRPDLLVESGFDGRPFRPSQG